MASNIVYVIVDIILCVMTWYFLIMLQDIVFYASCYEISYESLLRKDYYFEIGDEKADYFSHTYL